ncbi:MAG: DUF192 domain-containing protein [Kangiellaceae bacterium]|nr:DUF192 domain-containing protein [Kangiellaceae bacterium]
MSAASVDGRPVLAELYIARTAWQRTRGLLGRSPLTDSQGLLIEKCHSVHMVGMKYAIDLCYLDQDGRVMKTIDNFKPWHFSYCLGANAVIEMMSGMNKRLNLSKGKKIEWS